MEDTEETETVDNADEGEEKDGYSVEELKESLSEKEDEIEELERQIEDLEDENEELKRMVVQKKNSLKKQKERIDTKVDVARKELLRDIVTELTDVRRSLSKAVESDEDVQSGVEKTLRLLDRKLESNGVEIIEPDKGDECEPEKHEVISTEKTDEYEDGVVVMVHNAGYMYEDSVIKPAKVTTARNE